MPTKIVTKNQLKTKYAIPISFNLAEKYALEQLSLEQNVPLSTFIKIQLKEIMEPKIKQFSKTKMLMSKIQSKNLTSSKLDLAFKEGKKFRKALKLTNN